jgi:hypothetical protein
MPRELSFRPKEYICPLCGERTTFGTHFCKGERRPKPRHKLAEPIKRGAIALVGLLLVEIMLWDMIGIFSLYASAALALIVLAALAVRRSPLVGGGGEYRDLVAMAGGDKEAAERLVSMEKLRRPGSTRTEAVRAAIESYRRDLR